MKSVFAAAALLVMLPTALRSGPQGTVIITAMKLADQPNYSWTTNFSDDARTYEVGGMTKHGYTWQRQPMPKSVARRLGREAGPELEAIFRGPSHYVIYTDDGWRPLASLPRRHPDWVDHDEPQYVAVVVPHALLPGADAAWSTEPWPSTSVVYVPADGPDEDAPHSNYQFALGLPHEELAIIVSSFDQLTVDGEEATGMVSDVGARLLLVHQGHDYIKPLRATGTFKIWMKHGFVVRYQLQLTGVVAIKRKQFLVQQESSTIVADIGTTNFEVPENARAQLGQ